MIRRYMLPILAIVGLVFGLFMVWRSLQRPPTPPILFPPPQPPYAHFVAGAGAIEAKSENIAVGTPFNDIVTDVYVQAGDKTPKDAPLFKLDTRSLEARLQKAKDALATAIANYEDQKVQFSLYQRLKDKRAVSERDYDKQLYALEIAERQVEEARAAIEVVQTDIVRSTITAPLDGEVLKVNIRVGQTAQINPFDVLPLIVYGDLETLHVRVDIDEEDAWRVQPNKPAMAYVRGNSSIAIPLHFVAIEPYILPKNLLTGDNDKRVDTRVLQVLYSFKKGEHPVYVGQILDVYIEALPSDMRF